MKNLLLMRHAKSSWKDTSLLDHQRPLNKRGKEDAPRMGRYLREQGLLLEAILCSTAVRAEDTVEGFLDEYTFEEEVLYFDELYQAGPETIIALLKQLPDELETAMVVAHNPGLDDFLETVCGENEHMPTACVAHIQLPLERWDDFDEATEGKLIQLWKPREV